MLASSLMEPQDYLMFVIWLGPAIALAAWFALDRRRSQQNDKDSRRVS